MTFSCHSSTLNKLQTQSHHKTHFYFLSGSLFFLIRFFTFFIATFHAQHKITVRHQRLNRPKHQFALFPVHQIGHLFLDFAYEGRVTYYQFGESVYKGMILNFFRQTCQRFDNQPAAKRLTLSSLSSKWIKSTLAMFSLWFLKFRSKNSSEQFFISPVIAWRAVLRTASIGSSKRLSRAKMNWNLCKFVTTA